MNITPKNDSLPREGHVDFESKLKRSIVSAKSNEQTKADRTATDNEKWPPIDGTSVSQTDNGDMRYERDGQGVVVAASTNPKLFQFLKQLHDLSQSPAQKALVEKAIADGVSVADRNTELPAWGDIKNFEWQGQLETAEVVTYVKHDGEKVTVSKALTPGLFASAQQMGLSRVTVENRASSEGREVADENVYVAEHDIVNAGSRDQLGNGVIEFESRDGKKYVVSQFQNKELYDRVADKSSSSVQSDVQKIRDAHGLGNLDELDILSKPTGVKSDEKDKNSEDLTVVELATKNLMDKYQKLVDDKKVDKDSDVYKLVMAIQAKAGMESGRTITPYIESTGGAEGTWRKFDDKGETLTDADMQDILNGNNIDKALAELFANGNGEKDKIGKEYQAEMDAAIEKVSGGDKEALAKDLHSKLTSLEFVDYLTELDKAGKKSEGQSDVARLLSSLDLLNPDLAKDAQNELKKNSVMAEVDKLMADPGGIPDEYKELALKDIFSALKQGIKGMADIPRRTQDTIEKFINELLQDKTKLADFSDQMDKLNKGEITQAQFDEALAGKYGGAEDKQGFTKAIGKLNQAGVFGTAAGFTSLGGAIYMLTAKNGQLADDPLERLAIAKDFITFLGSGAQFEKTGIFDLMTKTNTAELLGLSKSIPEIWGKEGLWGAKIETAQAANNVPDVSDGLENRLANVYELTSIRAGTGAGSVLDQVSLMHDVNNVGGLSQDASRELLDDLVTRAGGQPPDDYASYRSLSELSNDLNLNISQENVAESINSQRSASNLPPLEADEVQALAADVDRAANIPAPASVTSSGYSNYSDAVSSLYEDAVEYFIDRDVTPPTREAFAAGIEDRLQRNGQPIPADNDRINLADALGDTDLDRESLNVMFEHDNRPPPADDVLDGMRTSLNQAINTPLPGSSGASLIDAGSIAENIDGIGGADTPKVPGVGARVAGSVVKVLGVAPDIMSIADIVMGGIAIKDGIKSGSDLAIANGSLQIVSGVAGTVAGGIGIAGLLAPIGAIAGATAPLFLITAGLGIITGIISVFVDHQKKQKATDKEGQWFKDQAELGFAQNDWGDKLEYGRYSFYEYEGRDAPTDQSIFDYQAEEWKHFQETPQEDGSSLVRLDDSVHIDQNGIVGENTNGLPMNVYNKAYYDTHKEEIETIREKWDDWNGKDDIVSKKDFEKILKDGDEKEKAAAEFILNDKGFFDLLDNLWKKDKRDTKLSTDDLDTWLKLIDVMDRTPGETVFYEKPESTSPYRYR